MSVILAIEPDAAQAETLRQVLRGRFGAELLVVKSKDQAVAAVNREVPDLVLVSALLSPRDEDLLIGHLRTIEEASHLQPLRIPQLRRHEPPQTKSRFGFGKKKPAPPPTGCDPADFAEEVASYLACAREIRKRPRTAAAAAMAAPAEAAYDPWTSASPKKAQEPLRDSSPDVAFSELVPQALAGHDDPVAQEIDRLIQNLDVGPTAADALLAIEPVIESLGEQVLKAAAGADEERRAREETLRAEEATLRAREDARRREEEEARLRAEEEARLRAEEERRQADEERRRAEEERRKAEEEARRAEEAARLAAELERMQAEAEARKAEEERRVAAELERVQAEAAARRAAEMAQWQEEAEKLRESTVRAREEVEAQAREALAAELAQVRAEAEQMRQAELERLQAEADERADAAARKAREAAEAEAARAFAEELARVRSDAEAKAAQALEQELARARAEAEAAANRALGDEVSRVREEAQARMEAELERVREETERARHAELSEAKAQAERLREAAAREARAAAEAAARSTLEAEIQRVRAEADERLAAELAQLRTDAERRRQQELEAVRRQVDEMREAAAQQARAAAAEALAAEVARAQAQAAAQAEAAARAAAERAAAQAAAAQAAAAHVPASRPPTIVRSLPKSDTSGPRLAPPSSVRLAASAPPPPPLPAAAPAATGSSSYYDLWREESDQPPAERPAAAAARTARTFLKNNKWLLPAAASVLIVVGAAITVDGSAWRARAQRAFAGLPAAGSRSEPAAEAAAAAVPTPAGKTGTLLVETTPPGARVLVDGAFRGVSPLTLEELKPGRHRVVLESSAGVVRREVMIRAGERTITSEAMISGWLEVFSRIPLEVHVNGRRIGTSGEGQITLPAGQHQITLRNLRFNYRDTHTVEVEPGKTTSRSITLPTGRISVTEPVGAEVWIEGQRIGAVPLHDAPVPIGTREVVVRHPESGDQRYTAEVRYGETTQVGPKNSGPPTDPSKLLPLSRKPAGT